MLIEDIFQPVEELSCCPAENCDNEKNIYVSPKNYLSFHVCYFFSRMWKIVEWPRICRKLSCSHVAVLINWNQIIDFFVVLHCFRCAKIFSQAMKPNYGAWRLTAFRSRPDEFFIKFHFHPENSDVHMSMWTWVGKKITMRQRLWNVVCGYAMQLSCLPGVHHSTIVSQVLHDDLKAVRRWVHLIPLCCSCWWLVAGLWV